MEKIIEDLENQMANLYDCIYNGHYNERDVTKFYRSISQLEKDLEKLYSLQSSKIQLEMLKMRNGG